MATKKKKTGKKKTAAKKKPAKATSKKSPRLKVAVRPSKKGRKAVARKPVRRKPGNRKTSTLPSRTRVRGKREIVDTVTFEPVGLGARSAGQSGDLQGLSSAGRADSESVDELLEEGNSFEAEVVKGVEDAGDADEGEVHTHEVPEDDVPGEYLDRD
jgi:hypothetical protein